MAFWGVEIKPGKTFTLLPDTVLGRLRISQATLGSGSSNTKSSSVQCNVGKKSPVLLCSLLPEKAESIHLELEFEEAEEVTFSVVGPRSIHLTGYVLGKTRHSLIADDESESYGEDIGDADTELSDGAMDEDDYGGSFIDDRTPSCSPQSSSTSEEENKRKRRASKRKGCRLIKNPSVVSDSEDDVIEIPDTDEDEDEDDHKLIATLRGNVKMDCDTLKSTCKKPDDVAGQATSDHQSDDDRKVTLKKGENLIGLGTEDCHVVGKEVKRKKRVDDDVTVQESDDRKVKRRKMVDDAEAGQATDDREPEGKKIKKQRKKKTNELVVDKEEHSSFLKNGVDAFVENGGAKTDLCTKTLSGGLVMEELEIGKHNGKVASSGRKVTVHYTGKLKEQGKVFFSTVRNSPLKFRLGKGKDAKDAALDGLHLGIDGMRVGGKRRLLIPPELGYGSEGTDGVPPNAWLVMEVELLKVR